MTKAVSALFCMLAVAFMYAGSAFAFESGVFSYAPVEQPVVSNAAAGAKPIGVGTIAAGGGILTWALKTTAFTTPVNLYVGISASALFPGEVFLLKPDGSLQKLSDGVVAWKTSHTGAIDVRLASAPVDFLPPDTYTFFFAVQEGSVATLWHTSVTVEDHWTMNCGQHYSISLTANAAARTFTFTAFNGTGDPLICPDIDYAFRQGDNILVVTESAGVVGNNTALFLGEGGWKSCSRPDAVLQPGEILVGKISPVPAWFDFATPFVFECNDANRPEERFLLNPDGSIITPFQ